MTSAQLRASVAPSRPSAVRFLLIAMLAPLMLAVLAWWLGSEYDASEVMRVEARAAFERRSEAGGLISRMADAESDQRGYVITGDPTYLTNYAPSRTAVFASFGRLERELAGDPDQRKLVHEMHALADRKFTEMDRVIADRRTRGIEAASADVASGTGKALMDRMRALSEMLVDAAERDRDARVDAFRARASFDQRMVWVAIGFLGLLLAAAALMIWRQRLARYHTQLAAHDIAERNRTILDSTIDAMAILNPSGTIETINAAATALLGYKPEELARRDVSVLIRLLDKPITFHQRIGLVDGQLASPYLPDRRIVHRDGHEIPVDIALGVMRLADGDHVVASVRDISERKRVEQIKDELMSTVSHELRTPLTSVVGALGLLRAESAGKMPTAAKRLIEIAENNSRRLIRLINDMLDIDRLQSGRLSLEKATIDLRDVVTRAGEGSQGIGDAASVAIKTELPDAAVLVNADSGRLLQVVTNLVSNAVRASPPHGSVTISLALSEDGSRAQISVDDEGSGVPEEFRGRIFGRFERAQGEEGIGTGLGLAISREIVARHDGRIWFEDRPSGGTRFAFVLDVPRALTAVQSNDDATILICEDDAEMAEMLASMVAAIGYRAECVNTAAAARAALASGSYKALLLDLRLPDESGLSVAHSLLNKNGDPVLPIIIVSALTPDGVAEPVPFDVIDWIEKPVNPDRLSAAIRVAVGKLGASRPTVLHLDDDADMLDITASALAEDARVLKAVDLKTARKWLQVETPDVAILDLNLAEGSGLDLLPMLVGKDGVAVPTIIYSAHDVSSDAAKQVDAVLIKSRGSIPDLKATIGNVLVRREDADR